MPLAAEGWAVDVVARVPARVQVKLLAAFLAIAMLLIMLGTVGLDRTDSSSLYCPKENLDDGGWPSLFDVSRPMQDGSQRLISEFDPLGEKP